MPNSLHTRSASLAPTTFNAETNTVEAVIAAGADVARGGYIERLPVANANLRGIEGAPVLDAHNQGSTRSVLGVIEKAWKHAGEIRARIKLSARADVAGTVRDIADGILRNLSIGYRVKQWADSTDSKGNRVRTAVAWSIHEASFVPIGADPGAQTRSNSMKRNNAPGADNAPESDTFTEEQIEAAYEYVRDLPANTELPPEIFDAIKFNVDRMDAEEVVRHRTEVRNIAKRASLPAEWADAQIDAGRSLKDVRAAAQAEIQQRTRSVPHLRVINPGPSPQDTLERRAEGLAVRIGGGKPSDAARQYANFSIVEHARDMLEATGIRTRGMNNEQILTRAMHTISDFPELLTGTGARLLKPAYEAARSPLVAVVTRRATASDFRTQTTLQLGEMPKLSKVSESGEITSVTRGEAKESWALDTYGSIFSISRKALINDDLNAFADFATAAGQAAAATEADLVVSIFTQSNGAGPVMGDGVRMFHADHGNYESGGAVIGVDSVNSARIAMMAQTGQDGATLINVRPDTLIVPPRWLTRAEQFVSQVSAMHWGDVNPFASKLTVVCEPRLEAIDDLAWYLADSRYPALVLGGLAGSEGPQLASRDGFDVLGREFRVTLDVGVGPNEWRGIYKQNGDADSNSDA